MMMNLKDPYRFGLITNVARLMKQTIIFVFLLGLCSPVYASDGVVISPADTAVTEETESLESEDSFGEEEEFEEETKIDEDAPSLFEQMLVPARFTIMHGLSYKTEAPQKTINNRSSLRLEYAKLFSNTFFVQLDTKVNAYWGNDHRSKDEDLRLEPNTREAFLQMSFGRTSLKLGRQIMIWGESDGGAITDVISPRDYSELFFIPLEESRIGQSMLVIDQFTDNGEWSLFYIPDPEFSQYPEEGTGYYYDPFGDQAEFLSQSSSQSEAEYGLRWKKTFGKSDVALMTASLLENDEAYRLDGFSPTSGKMLFTRTRQRFSMVGLAFNYVSGNFLYKGEIARKTPRSFNDDTFQIIEKEVRDSAIGLEYAPGSTYTLSLEMVNSHVVDWEDEIQNRPEDTNSMVVVLSRNFLNEDLTVNWMSSYSAPHETVFHSLRTSFTLNDNISIEFDGFYPDIRSENSESWIYRDQKQIAFRALVQF